MGIKQFFRNLHFPVAEDPRPSAQASRPRVETPQPRVEAPQPRVAAPQPPIGSSEAPHWPGHVVTSTESLPPAPQPLVSSGTDATTTPQPLVGSAEGPAWPTPVVGSAEPRFGTAEAPTGPRLRFSSAEPRMGSTEASPGPRLRFAGIEPRVASTEAPAGPPSTEAPSFIQRFGWNFTKSAYFEKTCRKAFDDVDVDRDGALDFAELYVALLKLYDQLNMKLPCHLRVPSKKDLSDLMVKFDGNRSGKLEFQEFLVLCRSLAGGKGRFIDSLFFKASVVVLLKVSILPLVAQLIKDGLAYVLPDTLVKPLPIPAFAIVLEIIARSSLPLPV